MKVAALAVITEVSAARPMLTKLKPVPKAAMSVAVICKVPAAPAIPIEVAPVDCGNKLKVLVPVIEVAPPLKAMVLAAIVKALAAAAKVLATVMLEPVKIEAPARVTALL